MVNPVLARAKFALRAVEALELRRADAPQRIRWSNTIRGLAASVLTWLLALLGA